MSDRYLLDANIFIQAKNLHYGFDFCPAFWEWLEVNNQTGKAASIEKVADELSGEDELAAWVEERGKEFFLPADNKVLPALGEVSTWATQQKYEQSAISTFLQVADYWLVAHAKAHNWTIVTHEVPAPNSVKKIKIPDVCISLGIHCINPYTMLRRERARFVLGSTKDV